MYFPRIGEGRRAGRIPSDEQSVVRAAVRPNTVFGGIVGPSHNRNGIAGQPMRHFRFHSVPNRTYVVAFGICEIQRREWVV